MKPLKISLITLSSLLALILCLLLFIYAFGGTIAKSVIEKHSEQWVARQITLDEAPRINPFRGSVTLTNVSMLEADKQDTFVRFDSLYAQISLPRLLRREVYLHHIWLSGFSGSVINQGPAFNFQDIISHFSTPDSLAPEAPEASDTTASSWLIALYDIRISRSLLTYSDLQRQSSWTMENINISVPGLEFGRSCSDAGITLDFPDRSGSLQLQGHYDMVANTFGLNLDLDSIRADMALPFIQDYLAVSQIGTRISGCLLAEGSLDRISALGIKGGLLLSNTDVRDLQGTSLLSLGDLRLAIDTIDLASLSIRIDTLSLDGLRTTFRNYSDHNTLSTLLVSKEAPASEDTLLVSAPAASSSALASSASKEPLASNDDSQSFPSSVAPASSSLASSSLASSSSPSPAEDFSLFNIPFSIKVLDLHSIHLTYEEHTLAEPFSYTISDLALRARDLTLSGPNNILLTAHLPKGGNVFATYSGGMDLHKGQEKLNLTVKNLQLQDFSPWCTSFTASPITAGTLSLTSDTRIRNAALRSSNKIDIFQLAIGSKLSPSDAPYKAIPVKLAVGILADMNHKINLDVPVTGNIDDPKFSYRKLIWRAIGNILLKATASPWVALGKALGINSEDLSTIAINPLQPDFTSEQYAQLDKLVQALQAEPELSISLVQQFNLHEAISQQQLFDQKRAYYESLNGPIQLPTLAEIHDIDAIKSSDRDFRAFLSATPVSVSDSLAREEVLRFAALRQHTLQSYFSQQQGLPVSRVSVRLLPSDSLSLYSSKPMFSVQSIVPSLDDIVEE